MVDKLERDMAWAYGQLSEEAQDAIYSDTIRAEALGGEALKIVNCELKIAAPQEVPHA